MKKILTIVLSMAIAFGTLGSGYTALAAEDETPAVQEASETNDTDTAESAESAESTDEKLPNGTIIWVKSGSKGGNGSKDAPFGNIETAKNMVLSLSAEQRKNGVTVMIREGEYAMSSSLEFEKADSGTAEAPIVYSAYNNEKVVIHGGVNVNKSEFKKVTDKTVLNRLDKSVRESVYEVDLKKSKYSDLGKNYCNFEANAAQEYSNGQNSNSIMLFYKDSMMQNAVYPNSGEKFARSMPVIENGGLRFYVDETEKSKLAEWEKADLRDAVLKYITKTGYGWYVTSMEGSAIDSKTNSVWLPPKRYVAPGVDSINNMARYWVYNLIEELDMPGEWAIDYANKRLYFLPPGGTVQDLRMSMLNKPLISLNEASYITFKGLTVGYTRNNGFNLKNCKNIVIDGCTVKGIGEIGVYMTGTECTNNTVKNGIITETGSHAVSIYGTGTSGKKYVPSENRVENCDISDTSNFAKMAFSVTFDWSPGTRIVHNRIHNTPSIAINVIFSIGSTIDYNEIYDVCRQALDYGAIYAPSDMSWGTSVSHNYIHDVIRYTQQGSPVNGIYLDSWGSGYICEGNIIKNVTTYGFHCNGSNSNSIHDNIIINAGTPIHVRDYSLTGWIAPNPGGLASRIGWPNETYKELFPSLEGYFERLNTEYSNYSLPKNNEIYNNIAIGCLNNWAMDANTEVYAKKFENNLIFKKEEEVFNFKASDDFNMTFTKDSPIYDTIKNFEEIDFSAMGLTTQKDLIVPELISPADGAVDVDVRNSELAWLGGEHGRFRVIAALDKNFDSVVLDKTVVGTKVSTETFKYGNVNYYWKVMPVRQSKADKHMEIVSKVHKFTSRAEEELNKSALSRAVRDIGSGFKSFDGYSQEAIERATKAYDRAKLILNSDSVHQRDVRSATIELQKAKEALYASLSTIYVNIDSCIKDTENWKVPEGTIVDGTQIMFPKNAKTRYAIYTGRKFQCGETLRFKGVVNYTNWQGFGFWANPNDRFENSPSLINIMRASGFEIQRRNYNDDGNLSGGIVANFENNGDIVTGEPTDFELGINEVHNGILFTMKVNGKTVVEYLDKTELAVTDGVYFGMHDASFSPMGVLPVNN